MKEQAKVTKEHDDCYFHEEIDRLKKQIEQKEEEVNWNIMEIQAEKAI